MESGDRNGFLARLRARVQEATYSPIRPVEPLADRVPAIAYRADLSDRMAQFSRALESVAGRARRLESAADLRPLLAEIVRTHAIERAVVSRDPECDGVVALLRELGVATEPFTSVLQAVEADLGVTGAAFGIALTGSVVVDAARAGGRTVSLLPRVHLALLRAERIVATPGAVLRTMPQRPAGLPSNLVLITGPSRSADIELQLTLGVHGPREVWVAVMGQG